MTDVMNTPSVAAALGRTGNRILKMSPAEAEAFVTSEVQTWSAAIRKAGISADERQTTGVSAKFRLHNVRAAGLARHEGPGITWHRRVRAKHAAVQQATAAFIADDEKEP